MIKVTALVRAVVLGAVRASLLVRVGAARLGRRICFLHLLPLLAESPAVGFRARRRGNRSSRAEKPIAISSAWGRQQTPTETSLTKIRRVARSAHRLYWHFIAPLSCSCPSCAGGGRGNAYSPRPTIARKRSRSMRTGTGRRCCRRGRRGGS